VLLAAGTAAYGRELARVVDLDAGRTVTKAVSMAPSRARAPRVAEFEGGMINAVGLANPAGGSRRSNLPGSRAIPARVLVNVVGNQVEDSPRGVAARRLAGFSGYELNVSCPNVKLAVSNSARILSR
jgi:dihydroorotate dehydrogenase (NAD+) catalytic subunit